MNAGHLVYVISHMQAIVSGIGWLMTIAGCSMLFVWLAPEAGLESGLAVHPDDIGARSKDEMIAHNLQVRLRRDKRAQRIRFGIAMILMGSSCQFFALLM